MKRALLKLKREALDRSERRRAVFSPFPAASVGERLRAGDQVFLPELREDAAWALSTLPDLKAKALLEAKTAVEQERVEAHFTSVKARLRRFLDDQRGIDYQEWLDVSTDYVAAAAFDPGNPHIYRRTPHVSGGYHPIPTARKIDIPTLDEWASEGLTPVHMNDRRAGFDGQAYESGELILFDSTDQFGHDLNHLETIPVIDMNPKEGLTPREYFQGSRRRIQLQTDPLLRKTIEARWHYIHHERQVRDGRYGPDLLLRELNPRNRRGFKFRLRKGDIGDHFKGVYPDDAMIEKADEILREYAEECLRLQR